MSEPTYTMAEAKRRLALEECARHGHSWETIQTYGGGPVGIRCEVCGWHGAVNMDESPLMPTSPRTARLGRARVNVTRRGVAR